MTPENITQPPATRAASSALWGARCAARGSIRSTARNLDQRGTD